MADETATVPAAVLLGVQDPIADAAIKDIMAGYDPNAPEMKADEANAQILDKPPTEVDKKQEVAPKTEDKPATADADRIAAQVRKEIEFDSREKDLARKEADYESRMSEVSGKVPMVEQLRSVAAEDPETALQALGVDPDFALRKLLATRLSAQGKALPPELQKELAEVAQKRTERTMGDKLKNLENQIAMKEHYASVQEATTKYVATGISEKYPALRALGTVLAHSEIMSELGRTSRNPGSKVDHEKAAAEVEKRLSPYYAAWTKVAEAKKDTATAPVGTGPITAPKQPLPEDKPTASWLKKKDPVADEGIQAGIREYQANEAKRKAGL